MKPIDFSLYCLVPLNRVRVNARVYLLDSFTHHLYYYTRLGAYVSANGSRLVPLVPERGNIKYKIEVPIDTRVLTLKSNVYGNCV